MNEVRDFFVKLFDVSDFPPRWHCGHWSQFHGWLYLLSDLAIWGAYFAIPLLILRYISRRHGMQFFRIYVLFAAFILACGATHFLDALAFWMPYYRLSALVRFVTAVISWITVFSLVKLLPVAFSLKTTEQLEAEIEHRKRVEEQLQVNNRLLTDGSWLVLTPRFHPSRDEIAFMSYANNRPRVYLFNLSSGRQSLLGDFAGMTFAPRFAPDGAGVVMTVANGGGSDIVAVDMNSHAPRRLTDSGAIDVSPCYSPDGSQIAFASDRGGDQQIYVMGSGGGGVKRISFGNGRYATPVWSPRGDLIAFTRYAGDTSNFAIGVMHPDGSGERILSEGWLVEGPTFAPNGRVLMFWRETRSTDARGRGFSSRLVSVDITGFNERPVETPTDASDPAWSPLIP